MVISYYSDKKLNSSADNSNTYSNVEISACNCANRAVTSTMASDWACVILFGIVVCNVIIKSVAPLINNCMIPPCCGIGLGCGAPTPPRSLSLNNDGFFYQI